MHKQQPLNSNPSGEPCQIPFRSSQSVRSSYTETDDVDIDRQAMKEVHVHFKHFKFELMRMVANESEVMRRYANSELMSIVGDCINLILNLMNAIIVDLKEVPVENFQWPKSLGDYARHESLSLVNEMKDVEKMCINLEEKILESIKKTSEVIRNKTQTTFSEKLMETKKSYEDKIKGLTKHYDQEAARQRKHFQHIIQQHEAEKAKLYASQSLLRAKVDELNRKVWSLPQQIEHLLTGPKEDADKM